ncbi:MAG: NADP-dependent oxidoreductase [Hellea sp.]
MTKATEIQLAEYPDGLPTNSTFKYEERELLVPKEGEITVRNHYMSVDPYMRGRMKNIKSYVPPFQIDEAMTGGAVGEVTASAHPDYAVGDHIMSMRGWRTAFTAPVAQMEPEGLRKIDTSQIPIQAYLGVAGMPGLTAYAGLYDIAKFKAGDTVLVSGAAGAVGSVVCQLAKADGGYVVGIAGTDSKADWLKSRGVDAVVNYKTSKNLTKSLVEAAPQGIDVYFENVGGDALEAAINVMNPFGRMAVCGMIANYNDKTPRPGPNNLIQIIGKSLKIQGFIVSQHAHLAPEYIAKLSELMPSGKLISQETILDGIENAPAAFLRLFDGNKQGKMLVKLT